VAAVHESPDDDANSPTYGQVLQVPDKAQEANTQQHQIKPEIKVDAYPAPHGYEPYRHNYGNQYGNEHGNQYGYASR
jgi:hypothetical protein